MPIPGMPSTEMAAVIKFHHHCAMNDLDRGYPSSARVNETVAADVSAPYLDFEPTRSVLHRSAASLALECGDREAARRLAERGLTGKPPEEIAEELRDVIRRVDALNRMDDRPRPASEARR